MLGVLVSFVFILALRSIGRTSYKEMSKRSMEGVTGALTARAEAHSMRLALIYALLDGASSIQVEHLKAALALWDYAARSAVWALGDATGDPLAEQIHRLCWIIPVASRSPSCTTAASQSSRGGDQGSTRSAGESRTSRMPQEEESERRAARRALDSHYT